MYGKKILLKPLKRGTLQFIFSLCNMSQNSVIRGAREVRLVSNISRVLRTAVTKSGAHTASKGDSGGDDTPPIDTSVRSLWVTCIRASDKQQAVADGPRCLRGTQTAGWGSADPRKPQTRVCIIMHDALFAIEITGGGVVVGAVELPNVGRIRKENKTEHCDQDLQMDSCKRKKLNIKASVGKKECCGLADLMQRCISALRCAFNIHHLHELSGLALLITDDKRPDGCHESEKRTCARRIKGVNTQTVSVSCANIWTLACSALSHTFCLAKSPEVKPWLDKAELDLTCPVSLSCCFLFLLCGICTDCPDGSLLRALRFSSHVPT